MNKIQIKFWNLFLFFFPCSMTKYQSESGKIEKKDGSSTYIYASAE